jgi:hypothetical protein
MQTEPVASSKCPHCGKDTPHVHAFPEQGYITKIHRLNARIEQLSASNARMAEALKFCKAALVEVSPCQAETCKQFQVGAVDFTFKKIEESLSTYDPSWLEADRAEVRRKALEETDICPDCLRKKAHSADDAVAGHCSKWYAIRDKEYAQECAELTALRMAKEG